MASKRALQNILGQKVRAIFEISPRLLQVGRAQPQACFAALGLQYSPGSLSWRGGGSRAHCPLPKNPSAALGLRASGAHPKTPLLGPYLFQVCILLFVLFCDPAFLRLCTFTRSDRIGAAAMQIR